MTEADYDAQISWNRQAAAGYRQEIQQMENEINELTAFRDEVVSLQDVLHDTADSAASKIDGMTSLWGAVSSVLNGSFFLNILNEIKGEKYVSADNGLGTSREIIQNKINELKNAIEQKQAAIAGCNAAVSSLEGEKAGYLAAKALEEANQPQAGA